MSHSTTCTACHTQTDMLVGLCPKCGMQLSSAGKQTSQLEAPPRRMLTPAQLRHLRLALLALIVITSAALLIARVSPSSPIVRVPPVSTISMLVWPHQGRLSYYVDPRYQMGPSYRIREQDLVITLVNDLPSTSVANRSAIRTGWAGYRVFSTRSAGRFLE
jgi:hypothetical protein